MIIAARYSFNGGAEAVSSTYPHLLQEVESALTSLDAENHRTKKSDEKTMKGQLLYSPVSINKAIREKLLPNGWINKRVLCEYSSDYYTESYKTKPKKNVGYRDMDFVKEKLGVEMQFGKYSFMVYNVAAKMTIFRNLGHIEMGIEVVPVKQFALQMSSGVSYFEQFTWDLNQRGVSNIDIPVLILGVDNETGTEGKRPSRRIPTEHI